MITHHNAQILATKTAASIRFGWGRLARHDHVSEASSNASKTTFSFRSDPPMTYKIPSKTLAPMAPCGRAHDIAATGSQIWVAKFSRSQHVGSCRLQQEKSIPQLNFPLLKVFFCKPIHFLRHTFHQSRTGNHSALHSQDCSARRTWSWSLPTFPRSNWNAPQCSMRKFLQGEKWFSSSKIPRFSNQTNFTIVSSTNVKEAHEFGQSGAIPLAGHRGRHLPLIANRIVAFHRAEAVAVVILRQEKLISWI